MDTHDPYFDPSSPRQEDGSVGRSEVSPAGAVPRDKRLTFREAVTMAERQVDYNHLANKTNAWMGSDVCKVMAEIYLMSPRALVRIGSEELEAELVQEVYREITQEHFEHVCEKLRRLAGFIRCPKPYIRTLLYNEVFEFECHVEADVEGLV